MQSVYVRVRVLFKATSSRLHDQCSDVSSRRKRQTDTDDEQLQYLNQQLITQAVQSGEQDIEQVILRVLYNHMQLLGGSVA